MSREHFECRQYREPGGEWQVCSDKTADLLKGTGDFETRCLWVKVVDEPYTPTRWGRLATLAALALFAGWLAFTVIKFDGGILC